MNCQQCREECEKLLDESLSFEERSEIEASISAHLETCPECASEFAFVQELRLTLPQLQNLVVAPPTFLRANVRAALVEELGPESRAKTRFMLPAWTRSMWAGGLVVAFGFLLLSRQLSPFSIEIQKEQNTSSERSIGEASPPAGAAAPSSRIDTKTAKSGKRNESSDILPEKTPVPAPRIFVSPAAPEKGGTRSQQLPTSSASPVPAEESANVKATEKAETAANAGTSAKAVAPSPYAASPALPSKSAPAPDADGRVSRQDKLAQPSSPPTESQPRQRLFQAPDAGKPRLPEAVPPLEPAAPMMARDNAPSNWQNGRITLALVPSSVASASVARENFAVDSATANKPKSENRRPPAPATRANEAEQNLDAAAQSGPSSRDQRVNEPKMARGGGYFLPAPALVPAPIVKSVPAPVVIPRKLILQSEYAISNARLLQNAKVIWEGNLAANKPVEIEIMAPMDEVEKNSFVLEQNGAVGESNRKSLTLGD